MNYPKLQNLAIIVALFWFTLQPATDPDTGWHLATGRYIIQNHQIPQTDPFSYSLPQHPYIAHSWAFDVLLFVISNHVGPIGLSVLYAVITTTALIFIAKTSQLITKNEDFLPFTPLIAYPTLEIVGQRPQAISVLGLAILVWVLLKSPSNQLIRWLPFMFLIWANLHAGVILGVVVLIAWEVTQAINKRSIKGFQSHAKILIACLIATLINPYTYQIYTFTLGMITNATSAMYNSDWVPLFSPHLDPSTLGLRITIVIMAIVAIIDNPLPKPLRFLSLIWLILSFKSLRYLVPLFSTTAPLILTTFGRLLESIKLKWWFSAVAIALPAIIFYNSLLNKSDVWCSHQPSCYGAQAQMPYGAVEYLKTNQLKGNIFNLYTWGGYLTWQLPESKIFIDGRMDNFFIGNTSFLQEFVSIHNLESNWYQKISSYQTDFILIPADWQEFQTAITNQNWRIIYRDNLSVVYQKP